MPSLRHPVSGTAALLAVMAMTACDHATADMVGPLDAATLAAAATRVSPTDLLADLGLDSGQQEQAAEEIGALHTAMLALHEAMPADVERMGHLERQQLHERLESQMKDVHERHNALMASLTDEQRQRFVEHVHARMEGGPDHEAAHGAEGLVERIHTHLSGSHR